MIAIHDRPRSFSARWAEYCKAHGVPFRLVNALDTDIVSHLEGCSGFMWHWHLSKHADQLFARQLTLALEARGLKVFPNVSTAWHYDDKLGQKYLLEAFNLPLVPAHVFYDEAQALAWLHSAPFPLVFKLRGGAGSLNVRLVTSYPDARSLVRRAFSRGFPPVDRAARTRERVWRLQRDGGWKAGLRIPYWYLRDLVGAIPRGAKLLPVQKGYVYFQEFVPGNDYDHRFIVIGNRCLCIQRAVRDGDFRASGSGRLSYEPGLFPKKSIALAFRVADSLKSQSIAIDVMYSREGDPQIGEVSYAFPIGPFAENCPGYFTRELAFKECRVLPPEYMIEDFLGDMET